MENENTISIARAIAMKETRLDAMLRTRDNAAETRETLGMIDAPDTLIRASDRRIMELNNAINKIRDEIFVLKQRIGIDCAGPGNPAQDDIPGMD